MEIQKVVVLMFMFLLGFFDFIACVEDFITVFWFLYLSWKLTLIRHFVTWFWFPISYFQKSDVIFVKGHLFDWNQLSSLRPPHQNIRLRFPSKSYFCILDEFWDGIFIFHIISYILKYILSLLPTLRIRRLHFLF